MTWAKFDDKFSNHPKVLEAGPLATCLHMHAIIYCAQYLTDGIIRPRALSRVLSLGTDASDFGDKDPPSNTELAKRLVNAGLWDEAPDGDGWVIHDYLDYNPSREHVEADRKKEANRKAAWRAKKKNRACPAGTDTGTQTDVPPGQTRDSHRPSRRDSALPDPTRPVPDLEDTTPLAWSDSATPQPQDAQARPAVLPVVCIPLVSGEHPVSAADVDEWAAAYPGVDVVQQLRAMRQWALANPARRKTARGVRRFIVAWLTRQQDRGPVNGGNGRPRRANFAELHAAAMEWAHAADEADGVRTPDG